MRTNLIAAIVLATLAGAAHGAVVTIYKHVDANGRVTYTNIAPKDPAGFLHLEIEVDAPAVAAVPVVERLKPAPALRTAVKAKSPLKRVAAARRPPPLTLRLDFRLGGSLPISMR